MENDGERLVRGGVSADRVRYESVKERREYGRSAEGVRMMSVGHAIEGRKECVERAEEERLTWGDVLWLVPLWCLSGEWKTISNGSAIRNKIYLSDFFARVQGSQVSN
ncbi:hypothetical protein WBG78_25065 [Chryseolinea sp. T2]|uniref:hypothetical protein n=1 Tax=Chryseolinea sp. T2 TaxID=3129255 RepID=UPI0030775499